MQKAPDTDPKPRPWIRRSLWALGGLIGLVLVALLAGRLLLASEVGRAFVESRIEAAAPAGQSIELTGLTGDLMDRFEIDQLVVSDANGRWLRVENVKVHWAPGRLVRRHLLVHDMRAGQVTVLRRPELGQPGTSAGSDSDLPLERIDLEELKIGLLVLEEPVIGGAAEFDAEARLQLAAGGGRVDMQLSPRDPGDDRLVADLAWGRSQPLVGEASLHGPPGGLFASLAGLDDGQGLSAALTAQGQPDAWSGDARLQIDETPAVTLTAQGTRQTVTLDGEIDLTTHPITRAQTKRLGRTAQFDLRWRRPGGALSLIASTETVRIEAARASGTNGAAPIELRAVSEAVARVTGLDAIEARRLQLDGTVKRGGAAWSFGGEARLEQARAQGWQAEAISGPVSLAVGNDILAASARLEARGFSGPGELGVLAGAAPFADFEAGLDRETGVITLRRLNLRAPGARAAAKGRLAPDLSSLDLEGDLNLEAGVSAQVPVSVTADWQASLKDGTPRLEASGTLADLPAVPDTVASSLGDEVTFEAVVHRPEDGVYVIESLSARAAELALSAAGRRGPDGAIDAELTLTGGPVSIAGLGLSPARLDLSANGPPDALTLGANLTADRIEAGEVALRSVNLTGDALWSGEALRGRARLQADHETHPVEARTDFAVSQSDWQLTDFAANWQELRASASLSGGMAGLSDLTGTADLSGRLPAGLPAERVDLAATLASETVRADGRVEAISVGPVSQLDLALSADGTRNSVSFSLAGEDGETRIAGIDRPVSGTLSGVIRDPLKGFQGLEASGRIDLGRHSLATRAPLRLETVASGRRIIADLEGLGGVLTARLQQAESGARLQASLSDIALADLMNLAGRAGLEGHLDAELELDTTGESATGAVAGRLSDLASPERPDVPLTLALDGRLDGEVLSLELRDLDAGGLDLYAAADTRLDPREGPLGLPGPSGAALRYRLTGNGEIAPLAGLLLSPNIDLTGAADVDLTGRWPSERIHPEGHARLHGGRFEHGTFGLVLEEVRLEADFRPGEVVLSELSARGAEGGSLSGTGAYRFDAGRNSLQVNAEQLRFVDRRDLQAVASGAMTLAETESGLALTGALTIDRGDIGLDALPDGGFTTLDVRFPDADRDDPVATSPQRESRLSLDIDLSAPGRVYVTGRGLDAELSLDGDITGTADAPRITGTATIVRGRFELAGRRFVFRDSQIRIDGDPMQAELDLTATRSTDALDVRAQITGTPRRPEVTLSSDPDLPEDEILSRVLFGRSPSQLSALETAQLASALSQLAGGGGFDLVGGLEDALGLDRLDIAFDESGAAEVTTGQYLAEDVYIEVKTGMNGLPRLIIEWQPRSNVEVEADLTSTEGQDLEIKWTRDFD